MKTNTIIIAVVAVAVIFGGLIFFTQDRGPGPYDEFAQCIKDSGTTFFGAFWCPHCQAQKKDFGSSAKLLPYVECSNPDGQTQTIECKDAGVQSYPTWEFPDKSRVTGEQTFQTLSEKTGCPLPATI